MTQEELYEFLEEKAAFYNRHAFIENDPVQIPHVFSHKEDIEIAGFLVAIFAWGNRTMIIKNGRLLMDLLEHAPHDFILGFTEDDLQRFSFFVHRTFNATDLCAILKALQRLYTTHGGIENVVQSGYVKSGRLYDGLIALRKNIIDDAFPLRSHKHIADVARGSSAKRLNMFLRWMIRKDKAGVDFGIWKSIPPSALMLPLDVHTGRSARILGLLNRKQNDWKAVEEVTSRLRDFDPLDPIRYDFALFGLGIDKHF